MYNQIVVNQLITMEEMNEIQMLLLRAAFDKFSMWKTEDISAISSSGKPIESVFLEWKISSRSDVLCDREPAIYSKALRSFAYACHNLKKQGSKSPCFSRILGTAIQHSGRQLSTATDCFYPWLDGVLLMGAIVKSAAGYRSLNVTGSYDQEVGEIGLFLFDCFMQANRKHNIERSTMLQIWIQ